jgi:hypothetical protein
MNHAVETTKNVKVVAGNKSFSIKNDYELTKANDLEIQSIAFPLY